MTRSARDVAAALDADHDRILEELKDLIRIPSISADSARKPEVARCAEWLADEMRRIGLEHVKVMPTAGNPVVYGDCLHAADAPTALVYGHYDVQPVDPLDEWDHPPFEPVVHSGKLFGRGAVDDKGQLFMHLKVVEAYLRDGGSLPMNLKVILEGEEEIGSEHLDHFVEDYRELLAADVAVISDTSMFAKGVPSITYGLRGLAYLQVDLRGADVDLHSGSFGGAVANPCLVLCELLAGLKDENDRVTIPGFYDRVREITAEERAAWAQLPFDETRFKEGAGVATRALRGERGFSVLERIWARPTLEINGIWGGFMGEGSKTIIPAQAHAKISSRLVPDQDPDEIGQLIRDHLIRMAPPTVEIDVHLLHGGKPSLTPPEHPAVQAGVRALERGFPGCQASFIREGGSIPVVATFQEVLGLPTILLGVGLNDEHAHAPNERFDLENFAGGMRSVAYLWEELASTALP